ncbi:sugar kinase [Massilia forsythiae]|uniref:Sugar kinase n=1 Tax=Massilia forsythiae TaxID=2728020 RepID=A0A7Z2W078_9BURK|nr:sugar kinase [Massilia forsythiae]QJE02060.1 sugar kinase [Massilia forsythiae]
MTVPDVVTVGEAMALLMARTPGPLESVDVFERATAGAELNVAVGLARLGFHVGYIGSLGKDSAGRRLRAFMAAERLDLRHLWMDVRYPTGLMLKQMAVGGADPEVEYFRRGSAASHLSARDLPAPDSDFGRARLVHLTGICPALSRGCRELAFALARQARAGGRTVSFDPNLRPRLWPSRSAMIETVNALACEADLVLPGLAEGRMLTGCDEPAAIAGYYLERGVRQVVVKLGPAGAYVAGAGVEPGIVPGVPVARVVDTVGAGDGFAVGVISALLDGLDLRDAAARGCAIGARVVQFRGDCDGLPDRAQLDEASARAGRTGTHMETQA